MPDLRILFDFVCSAFATVLHPRSACSVLRARVLVAFRGRPRSAPAHRCSIHILRCKLGVRMLNGEEKTKVNVGKWMRWVTSDGGRRGAITGIEELGKWGKEEGS